MAVVLITGVSRFLGGRLAAQLAADPSVERVIGIDTLPPAAADVPALGRTEFVRADIRNPLVAKVISQAQVTTVVHAGVFALPRLAGGRASMQEINVIGTMQLLGACQKSETVSRVVLASTAAVYGASARNPAVLDESMPSDTSRGTYARDAVEVEGFVRGFARRRPDVAATVLRFATLLGPSVDNALTRYFSMPVVPTPAGFDPRLQFVHEADAVEVLRRAAVHAHPGIFNVAGQGVLPLSQVLRRLGRVRLPVPPGALGLAGLLLRNSGVADLAAENSGVLVHGRALDTTRLRTEFGYAPHWTSADAVDAFRNSRRQPPRPALAGLSLLGSHLLTARAELSGSLT